MNYVENTSEPFQTVRPLAFKWINRFSLLVIVLIASSWVSFYYFDQYILQTVKNYHHDGIHPLFNDIFTIVKGWGKGETNVLIAGICLLAGYKRLALQIVLALIITAVLVWPLKVTVQRERPYGKNFVSFPSGDAASAASMAVPLVNAFPATLPVAAIITALVACGRVVSQSHYPSDVLFGTALGLIAGFLALRYAAKIRFKYDNKQITRIVLFVVGAVFLAVMAGLAATQISQTIALIGPALILILMVRYLEQAESYVKRNAATQWMPVLLIGIIVALFTYSAGASTLWDRDEPRYARAAIEMMRSGSLMVPTFNGEFRLHKPILVYWVMQPFVRFPVQIEVAVRLTSICAFAACCFITYRLGIRLRSRMVGLFAFAAMAGTPLAIMNGTASTTDSLLLLCTSAAMLLIYQCTARGLRPVDFLPLGAALGAAQLTKGPVGLFVPLFGMFALAGAKEFGSQRTRNRVIVIAAVILSIVLFLLWFIPANALTDGTFYDFAFRKHVVGRSLSPMEGHGSNFLLSLPYYLPVLIIGFFPWVLYLPAGIHLLCSERYLPKRDRTFLIFWIAPTLVLMTIVSTKLPHYILPVWPALGLLSALVLDEAEKKPADSGLHRNMARGIWIFCGVGIILTITLLVVPWFLPIAGLRIAAFPSGLVTGIMTVACFREHHARRYQRGAIVLIVGILLLQLSLAASLLPEVEKYKLSPAIAEVVRSKTTPDTPVSTYQYHEPSLIFYLDRQVVRSLPDEAAVANWARTEGSGVLILPRKALEELTARYGILPVSEIGSKKGINIGKIGATELVAVVRSSKRKMM